MAKHSDETRERAVERIRGGESYRAINADTGVALGVLSKWAKDAGIEPANAEQTAAAAETTRRKWTHRRGELTDRLGDVIEQLLDKVEADNTPARDVRDYVWSAAVLTDKAQLLSGGVTSRHEQMNAERARERIGVIADELEARRAAKDGTGG